MPGAVRLPDARVPLALFCLSLAVSALFAQGKLRNTDAAAMAEVTASIVERGDFAVPPGLPGQFGLHGKYYCMYGLGTSLAAVPWCALGEVLYTLGGGRVPHDLALQFAMSWFNPVVVALLAVALYGLAREAGLDVRAAIVAAATCALGTTVTAHVKDLFSEPLTALCLVLAFTQGLRVASRGPRAALYCGLFWGAAFLTRAAYVAAWPALLCLVIARARGHKLLACAAAFVAGAAVGVAAFAAYNIVRFGSWSDTGYWSTEFSTSLMRGLSINLASPERGILWYSPALLLLPLGVALLWRQARTYVVAVALFFVPDVIVHSMYGNAYGGQSWGSRYMAPIVPLLCVFVGAAWQAASARGRRWVWAVVGVSALAQFPALYVNHARYYTDARLGAPWPDRASLATRIAWSPVARGWTYVPELTAALAHPAQLRSLSTRPGKLSDTELETQSLYFHIPYIWWIMAVFNGVPAALGLAVGLALVAACVAAALWMRRLWRENGTASEPDGFRGPDGIEVTVA